MLDPIAPTKERLAKARSYVSPEISQTAKRPYHRTEDEFERLHRIGKLDEPQNAAATKFKTHWYGALGVKVGSGEGGYDDCCEYPQTYHAQKLAQAERALTFRMWQCMSLLLADDGPKSYGIEHVGGSVCRVKHPTRARDVGLELVQNTLDTLAKLWGTYQTRPPSR